LGKRGNIQYVEVFFVKEFIYITILLFYNIKVIKLLM